jgi:hypothetical protein
LKLPLLVKKAAQRLAKDVSLNPWIAAASAEKVRNCFKLGIQKLCSSRKSLALPSTPSLVTGSGIMRAISTAPIIVEKITKKARSLYRARRPA